MMYKEMTSALESPSLKNWLLMISEIETGVVVSFGPAFFHVQLTWRSLNPCVLKAGALGQGLGSRVSHLEEVEGREAETVSESGI